LADLGESWQILVNFASGLAKKFTHSRGLLCVVAVCLRPNTETNGTTSEAKKFLQHEDLLQVRHTYNHGSSNNILDILEAGRKSTAT